MKKILTLFFTSILFSILFLTKIEAIEKPFDISLHTDIQNPDDKSFNIIAKVNSKISNDRVTIEWNLPEYLQVTNRKILTTKNVEIYEGENIFKINVKAKAAFKDYISFTITAFEIDKKRQDTHTGFIEVNDNLELIPIRPEYNHLKSIALFTNIAKITTITSFILFIVLIVTKYIKNKYFPEKPIPKTPRGSKILDEYERRLN